MANQSKNKLNQPPTGEGKEQSPYSGKANELDKRSEVLQAQRGHAEANIGTDDEDDANRSQSPLDQSNPNRPKAGR